jgi:hypothetical protein
MIARYASLFTVRPSSLLFLNIPLFRSSSMFLFLAFSTIVFQSSAFHKRNLIFLTMYTALPLLPLLLFL